MGPETARFSRIGSLPEKSVTSKKYLTKSLWLNNNRLTSIENVEALVNSVIDVPAKLGWLDLSFNHISEINQVRFVYFKDNSLIHSLLLQSILKFENIKILYLHGNNISEVDEVYKLRNMKHLKTLTLHGNPITDMPKYRSFIIAILPQVL